MKLNKGEVKKLYEEALSLVKSKPPEFFNLRKMRDTVGLCYWSDIELDYRRDIIPTAFHELFHYMRPDWSESNIKYAESRVINTCTPLEVATFFKYLADKLFECEFKKEQSGHQISHKKRKIKYNQ